MFSGLALKGLGRGRGYEFISRSGSQTASPRGRPAASSKRPVRIATEEELTAGTGTHREVVGFEIKLSKIVVPTLQSGHAGSQPVSLFVEDKTSAGLILNGTATMARGGRIVVIARANS